MAGRLERGTFTRLHRSGSFIRLDLLRAQLVAQFLPHIGDQQHVRRGPVQLEIPAHIFLQHARGEGPEGFTELDAQVHGRLHRLAAGVADDAARPQRPRAELHPPVEPAHHLAADHRLSGGLQQLAFVGNKLVADASPIQEPANVLVAERRPQPGAAHRVGAVGGARAVQQLVLDEQGRPKRPAGIARRGLNEDLVEDARAQQLAIGDAVERHAAGQAKRSRARQLAGRPGHAQDRLLRHLLNGSGDIHLALGDPGFRFARRSAEERLHLRARHSSSRRSSRSSSGPSPASRPL